MSAHKQDPKAVEAEVRISLHADSGYTAEVEGRISAEQWGRILAIVHEAQGAADVSIAPVAWRVKDYADGWILCHSLAQATREADGQCAIEPLYRAPTPLNGIKNGVRLEPDEIRFLMTTAGIGDGFDKDDAAAVVLWLGETVDHEGESEVRTYGLNAYNVEVPEEGSVCIRELPSPVPTTNARG